MTKGVAFWVVMLLWAISCAWSMDWKNIKQSGGQLMLFILLTLLGWRTFGPPLYD